MVALLLTISLSISLTWILSQALNCPSVNTGYRCACDSGDNTDAIGEWTQICFTEIYGMHETAYVMDYSRTGILKINCDAIEYLTPSLFLNITKVSRFRFLNCKVKDSFYDLLNGTQVIDLFYQSGKQEISAIFRSLYDLKVLTVTRNELTMLSSDIFSDLTSLEVLNLSQNELVNISSSVFANLQNLVTLSLSRNRLVNVPEHVFLHLNELKSLFMSRNSISDLAPNLLANLSSLETLDFSYNQIHNLSENFLADQVNLKRFEIHFNRLRNLPPSLFKNAVQLRIVDVSSNPIHTIPEDLLQELTNLDIFLASSCQLNSLSHSTFANNSNLKEVKLNGNQLKEVPLDLFKNMVKLKKLNLADNPLKFIFSQIFSSQSQLEWLSLARCHLRSIPEHLFASVFNLKYLDMSGNRLTYIQPNVFMNLINLVDLNLKGNMIQYINSGLPFGQSSALKRVDLSRNHLIGISNNIQWQNYLRLELLNLGYNRLSNFSVPVMYSETVSVLLVNNNITTISVQELLFHQEILDALKSSDRKVNLGPMFSFYPNPIKCDCFLYDFAKMATSYFRIDDPPPLAIFPLATRLTCQSPTYLKGKNLSNVMTDEFRCNIKANCPKTCNCYQRAFDGIIVVDCQSRGLTKFPTVLPINTSIVHFENNSLSDVTPLTLSLWENCTEMYLSGNKIQSLEGLHFSSNLKRITLNDNRLKSLLDFIETIVNTPNIQVTLSGNPYQCDCNDDIVKFLLEGQATIEDLGFIRCSVLKDSTTRYISSCLITNKSEVTFQFQTILFIVLLIILGCFIAVFIHHQHHAVRTLRIT